MTKIYEQFDAAFSHVSAFVLMTDGKQIGKIAFKFPKDGAGRLYCYFHFHGAEMCRGMAGGYGYDKKSAAVQDAIRHLKDYEPACAGFDDHARNMQEGINLFRTMFKDIGGKDWSDVFRDNNIQVLRAI